MCTIFSVHYFQGMMSSVVIRGLLSEGLFLGGDLSSAETDIECSCSGDRPMQQMYGQSSSGCLLGFAPYRIEN